MSRPTITDLRAQIARLVEAGDAKVTRIADDLYALLDQAEAEANR